MELPQIVEARGMRVLTTKQLSEMYEVDTKIIQYNFRYNKNRYIVNKHYIQIIGEELRELKTRSEFQSSLKYAKSLYLWTEKGALLHAKSLNTDKAWQVYDYLVDFYFRAKEVKKETEVTSKPQLPQKKNIDIKNPIMIFKVLIRLAEENNMKIRSADFKASLSCIRGNRIGIKSNMTLEEVDYELAYALSHAFIHKNEGDLINSYESVKYNERAERSADMIIKMLDIAFE